MVSGRDTIKHAAVYSSAALLGKIVGFLMLPFYAHSFHGEGYAVIGMLEMGLGLLTSLLAHGVRNAVIRLYHEETIEEQKPTVVSTGVILTIIAASVATTPIFLFSKPISSFLLEDPNRSKYLIMALFSFLFDFVGQAASVWLLIHSRSLQFASVNLFRLICGLGLNIWLIVVRNMGLDGYFISSVVTAGISCSIFLILLIKNCPLRLDKLAAVNICRFLVPLIPGSLISFFARQAERVLLRFIINLESVGILEMGYKFPVLITQMITTPFMQSWDTRRFEIADNDGASEQIGKMYTTYLFIVLFAGLVLAVSIKLVLEILTPPEFHPAFRIARLEILTLILHGTFYHFSFGLLYAKKTSILSKIIGSISIVKVILAWGFISAWGISGAAISATISSLVTAVITLLLSQKFYKVPFEWRKIIALWSLALILFWGVTTLDVTQFRVHYFFMNDIGVSFLTFLNESFVANIKSGKIIVIIQDNLGSIGELVIKIGLCLSFLLIVPAINPSLLKKKNWFR